MNTYLTIKWIHILSSVIMVGTGFGSALYMFFANRYGDMAAKRFVSRMVVKVDWWFTAPTVIIQPISGIILIEMSGWPLSSPWLIAAFGLYIFVGACWLPVVWLQIIMAKMTENAHTFNQPLPAEFKRAQWWWEFLGYFGFSGTIIIFYLMTAKPTLW